ncbi:uncharacterized protein CMU_030100 [Cryptosporidium muris RN66]|uniref:RING-type domain-containing protein n=1 Tax=Cryptosporidium muris (strain RN66) TaxID=441375 RepID=B6AI93_CRYMR|nr:uncharacterized protein CMU_030100 [Cryptosporidium muris RN66]EEA07934.1 hypothetical protein, conserved [Cryptosporidium muris RN66]|eukprot:XP_002142283.1 hypothetical protein [Cryptosporidium muris RN66]
MTKLNDEESIYLCPICLINTYYKYGVHLYYGEPCGHRFCSECANKSNKKSSGIRINTNISNSNNSKICPVCRHFVRFIIDYEYGETNFIKLENIARKQVLAIMNKTRQDFENTPIYNDYLEDRETTINKLINGDENEKKVIQDSLNQYAKEHQLEILERQTKYETSLKNTIRDIVKKEGTFYEELQQAAQNNVIDYLHIVHPLQAEYPEYFQQYQDNSEISSQKTYKTQDILGNNIPTPIDNKITSRDKIPIQKCLQLDLRIRAGGVTENLLWNRCKDELFSGFIVNKRNIDIDINN